MGGPVGAPAARPAVGRLAVLGAMCGSRGEGTGVFGGVRGVQDWQCLLRGCGGNQGVRGEGLGGMHGRSGFG